MEVFTVNDLLPGFTCNRCGVFTGTAKVDHTECRACGTPKPSEDDVTMLQTLTVAQERGSQLMLENQRLKAALRTIRIWSENGRQAVGQIPEGGAFTRERQEAVMRGFLASIGMCESMGVRL
jgi:hypothetical protein